MSPINQLSKEPGAVQMPPHALRRPFDRLDNAFRRSSLDRAEKEIPIGHDPMKRELFDGPGGLPRKPGAPVTLQRTYALAGPRYPQEEGRQ